MGNRLFPLTIVDSATLAQVVQFLDTNIKEQYLWSITDVVTFVSYLILNRRMFVAPGLKIYDEVRDTQDLLLRNLKSIRLIDSIPQTDISLIDKARKSSIKWIRDPRNIILVKREVDEFMGKNSKDLTDDQLSFQRWMDWSASQAWISHARRYNGLFDIQYSSYIAQILDLTITEVSKLHEMSKDPYELIHLEASRNSDYDVMTRAYIASTIIRGRYHQEIASMCSYDNIRASLIQHPIRGLVSRKRTKPPILLTPPETVYKNIRELAIYALVGSMRQTGLDDRIKCLVDNICKVQKYCYEKEGELNRETDAYSIARKAGVQIHNSEIDKFLSICVSLGVGVLTGLKLNPWWGATVSVGTELFLRKTELLKNAAKDISFQLQRPTLTNLAGLIDSVWVRNR